MDIFFRSIITNELTVTKRRVIRSFASHKFKKGRK